MTILIIKEGNSFQSGRRYSKRTVAPSLLLVIVIGVVIAKVFDDHVIGKDVK